MQTGHVYIMQCGHLFKIGCSAKPKERRVSIEGRAWLQSATSCPVTMLKVWPSSDQYGDERKLHGRLWRHHQAGEWSSLPPRVLSRLLRLATLDTLRDEWANVKP